MWNAAVNPTCMCIWHLTVCCSIVDVTAYLYFIGFAPLIYFTFLRNFFMYAFFLYSVHVAYNKLLNFATRLESGF